MEIDFFSFLFFFFLFYLYGSLELFIMCCRVRRLLCCPISPYYSEAVSEKVMVNDVKHESDEADTNAQCACTGFLLSVTFVSWFRNERRGEIKLTSIMHLPEKCFVVLLFALFCC